MKKKCYRLSALVPGALVFAVMASCASRNPSSQGSSGFEQNDSDGDGKLSPAEVADISHRQLLARYDLNSDNQISADEWKSSHPSKENQDAHFNRIDKSGDGHISVDEAVLFATEHADYSSGFGVYDVNDDGFMHADEYSTAEPDLWNFTILSLTLN